jgi:signal transduction histidine kinase
MERVDKSGRHLLGLINAVLDLSKIEAGQLTLSLNDYSLAELVHTVYTATELLAREKALDFRLEVAPNLPTGYADERRLHQVLLNLVGNAIKFTDSGRVTIRASTRAADDEPSFHIEVQDTGPGIPPEEQDRIFEEFQQADASSTRAKGGTGLGLAIAKRIVELHGGHISVHSTPGHGSTFSFDVPVRVEEIQVSG